MDALTIERPDTPQSHSTLALAGAQRSEIENSEWKREDDSFYL